VLSGIQTCLGEADTDDYVPVPGGCPLRNEVTNHSLVTLLAYRCRKAAAIMGQH
jgi:hypothetical protein